MELIFNTNGNEKQKQVVRFWIDPTTSDILYGGSKGSGKSFLGVSLIFGDAFIYPETSYFIARKSLTNIRKFTIPSIYEVFTIWGITQNMWRYNGQDNFYELHNGSRVYLLDASYQPSDPEFYRFGSMQITRGWIEEAGEFELAAKNNLAASIGRWKNDIYNLPPKLLQTCNPSKNYLYRDYYKESKAGTLPNWRKFVQALPQDNKKLPKGYLENLERTLSKNEKERLLYGNWEYDDDPSTLIPYDKIVDCFTNTHVATGDKKITADIARFGGDKIVIVEWEGYRANIKSYSKKSLQETADLLEKSRLKLGIGKSDILVDEDGVGGGIVDFYKCKGFVNNSRPLPVKNGNVKEIENFDNLKSQCYFKFADRVNNNCIFLQCDNDKDKQLLIEEMEQIKQKNIDSDMKKGVIPKEKIKDILGRSPDYADALMMREWFNLKTNVIYASADYSKPLNA
jgi:phage terminase large subunit